jgi:hypothetical protein
MWIGVDLDGTLCRSANYGEIGEPLQPMVDRVKAWLIQGYEVRIFTARAGSPPPSRIEAEKRMIEDWSERMFGRRLRVTATKDDQMFQLWDDRAIAVIPETGQPRAYGP